MYKEFQNPLPLKYGRMFVGNNVRLNQGPARQDDTITFRVGENTDFYVLVTESSNGVVYGEIVGIGPDPKWDFKGWSYGDKIKVSESAITAIIRAN